MSTYQNAQAQYAGYQQIKSTVETAAVILHEELGDDSYSVQELLVARVIMNHILRTLWSFDVIIPSQREGTWLANVALHCARYTLTDRAQEGSAPAWPAT